MPITIVGRNDRMGPGECTPNSSPSQPHWKIAVIAPKVANSDRMKPSVAVSGTSSDRNTNTRITNDSPTTSAR